MRSLRHPYSLSSAIDLELKVLVFNYSVRPIYIEWIQILFYSNMFGRETSRSITVNRLFACLGGTIELPWSIKSSDMSISLLWHLLNPLHRSLLIRKWTDWHRQFDNNNYRNNAWQSSRDHLWCLPKVRILQALVLCQHSCHNALALYFISRRVCWAVLPTFPIH